MSEPDKQWDFFLAHASADSDAAGTIYEMLEPHARVFLDKRCLTPGDNWDRELSRAQQKSLITVALVSNATNDSKYAIDEIATANELAGLDSAQHRLVPVYLCEVIDVPYGLRTKHAIQLDRSNGLEFAARELLKTLNGLFDNEKTVPTNLARPTLTEVETHKNSALLSPYASATFKLHDRHKVRLEAKNHVVGLTISLVVDGEILFEERVAFAANIKRNFSIDGVPCSFTIQYLAVGNASFSVAGQTLLSL